MSSTLGAVTVRLVVGHLALATLALMLAGAGVEGIARWLRGRCRG